MEAVHIDNDRDFHDHPSGSRSVSKDVEMDEVNDNVEVQGRA